MAKENQLGIETIKTAILFLIALGEKVDKALEDLKLTWVEGVQIAVTSAPGFITVIKNGKELVAEVVDLSPDEIQELIAYIATELKLGKEYAEKRVVAALKVAEDVAAFFAIQK